MAEVKHKYIFPDILASAMSRIDMRTQLEASMLSMSLMGVGLVVTVIYMIFYFNFAVWYKIYLVFNGIAGLVFMFSFLVTTYQQYLSYMDVIDFQKQQSQSDLTVNVKGGIENNA